MRRRALLRTGLAIAILLAASYGGVSWVFSNKLIARNFAPLAPVEAAKYGLPEPRDVTFQAEGATLAAWYFPNPRRAGCGVIMLHGFGGSREEVIGATPVFWDRGCDLLLYDARGHGRSSPALLTYGARERQDAKAAIDWLAAASGLPRTRVGLMGWSYGAATAIQAASEISDVAFVIADSSYSSLGDIARVQAGRQFGEWSRIFLPGALAISGLRAGFQARDAAPADAIRRVRAPVLLIHSRQDGFTPVQQSEIIFARSDQTRTILAIPDWEAAHGHSHTVNPAGYTAIVDRFLNRFVPAFGERHTR